MAESRGIQWLAAEDSFSLIVQQPHHVVHDH